MRYVLTNLLTCCHLVILFVYIHLLAYETASLDPAHVLKPHPVRGITFKSIHRRSWSAASCRSQRGWIRDSSAPDPGIKGSWFGALTRSPLSPSQKPDPWGLDRFRRHAESRRCLHAWPRHFQNPNSWTSWPGRGSWVDTQRQVQWILHRSDRTGGEGWTRLVFSKEWGQQSDDGPQDPARSTGSLWGLVGEWWNTWFPKPGWFGRPK